MQSLSLNDVPSSLDPTDMIMHEIDHDRVVEATYMEFSSHLTQCLDGLTASVKWDDQGQSAFLPIPAIPMQDKHAMDQILEINNVHNEGSNLSSSLPSSNSLNNGGGKLLPPRNFAFSFALPPSNSSVGHSTAGADGSALPMDVCLLVSDTKMSVTNEYTNLFQVPPPSGPHKQVVTPPLFQLPLPSGPGIVPPNTDTPAAVKLSDTQGIFASSLFQLPPPSDNSHIVPDKPPAAKLSDTQGVVTSSLFQLPPPSDDSRIVADTPPAAKLSDTQGVVASSLFELPPPSAPQQQPLFHLPLPSAPKSQQESAKRLFNVTTGSTPSHGIAQPEIRWPPGLSPSSPVFLELLTELLLNFSSPAGMFRGHGNSLRRNHEETTHRMVENLNNRVVLANLVARLQLIIALCRRAVFREHFPSK
ncbi:uncharacterized protein LACBIDRAFT_308393 [Laccaria bicolor S238N-H82]|uniref:Predicted protein n=1 Tax=Laccaria bicolor (strain S238N-H82 / ATCC MYA-4686) TaxID=486041 RepID=B0CW63_LACBS|nr:uncharacterized protein LACBIDRAFT_308393 [Laccaria bicolor S238N-H82]EDR13455.1 predicted protein [Laccaria bicolor S238N-H82]|eukprot:XP_001875953.1 predicted protein [Laccaria bicolor S238N-H82]